jgi:hypothetical protein
MAVWHPMQQYLGEVSKPYLHSVKSYQIWIDLSKYPQVLQLRNLARV